MKIFKLAFLDATKRKLLSFFDIILISYPLLGPLYSLVLNTFRQLQCITKLASCYSESLGIMYSN